MKRILVFLFFLSVSLYMSSCRNTGEKKLADVEKQELATGIRYDSLFLGLSLGMTKRKFFDYCLDMNKKGIFTEGADKTVEYDLGKMNFHFPIQMNFYPNFKEDKISALPIKFTYKGIDLSYPNGQTEKLAEDVKKLMKEWYGDGFFITPLPNGGKGYAKVSGNRRVLIFSEKEYEIMVIVRDLTVE